MLHEKYMVTFKLYITVLLYVIHEGSLHLRYLEIRDFIILK